MRLTNIAQLPLPTGSVHSYDVSVAPHADRPLPVSFDQGRHVGAGDRPGSWMAISLRMPGAEPARLAAAWRRVLDRHHTLRTVFSRTSAGEVRLHEAEIGPGVWRRHPVAPGRTGAQVVREVFDTHCRPFTEPSHRLCLVIPDADAADPRPVVIVGSDHAHVDMWSLLVLARDLSAALGGDTLAEPVAGFDEHTALLAAAPAAPAAVQEAWHRVLDAEGGVMPRFPLPLGDVSAPRPEVVEVRDVLDADGVRRLGAHADAAGVRVTALALSVLTRVTRELAGAPLRAVFPVHSRNEQRWHDAVGWFITNAVIECDDPAPRACAAALKQALILGSHPLAPILAPYGGMPQAPGMFAVSWLDLRRLPVAAPPASDPYWVSAVIETDGVMVWFVVDDSGMHLRCRYPDTPEARASLSRWLDAVGAGLAGAA
ncbi:MAG: peptide synthetase [Microbacterium sp.]